MEHRSEPQPPSLSTPVYLSEEETEALSETDRETIARDGAVRLGSNGRPARVYSPEPANRFFQ